jgi:NADH:ubiquinone oxidoreductase subunit 5 (subunit L)/multisubunit Na+/H+ antiporter MnhA subunit
MTNNLRFFSILKLFVAASSTLVASSTLAQILDYETVTDELLQNPPSGDWLS